MSDFAMFLLGYGTVGFIVCIYLLHKSEKLGKTSPIMIFWGNGIGQIFGIVAWPLIALMAMAELTFPEEKKITKQQNSFFEAGELGVVSTHMRPSGRVKIGKELIEAVSISGPLDPGDKIEILSKK